MNVRNTATFCTFSVVITLQHLVVAASLIVDTPLGKIQGMEMTAQNNKPFIVFRNIPYAKPPIGDLRFAKPQPHHGFYDTTFDATKEIISCIQPQMFVEDGNPGTEDCLILNIYLKDVGLNGGIMRKVMFYIHGGGFAVSSSAIYNPGSFVIDHDVIVVTINYRLGVLGFLSSENEASPGNYGLWDQALALKWVKDNIGAFGGDPDDITIAGESAGGASASLLSISPITKGLFTKAYAHSGSAYSYFAHASDPQSDFLRVAKAVGCWEDEHQEVDLSQGRTIVECLRKCSAIEISNFQPFSVEKVFFAPTVDNDFLPKHPFQLLQDNSYLESIGFFNIPYLTVFNNNEKQILNVIFGFDKYSIYGNEEGTNEDKETSLRTLFKNSSRNALRFRLDSQNISEALADKVFNWYERRFADDAIVHLVTDLFFLIPNFDIMDVFSRSIKSSARLIYFNYYPSFMRGSDIVTKGMIHGLDIGFWFDFSLDELEAIFHCGIKGDFNDEDLEVKKIFSGILVEFMKTGNPEKALTSHLAMDWPTYTQQEDLYLDLSSKPSIQSNLEKEKRKFWNYLVPQWASEFKTVKTMPHTEL